MATPLPLWTENTLQGLAYWVGYRRSYYRNYPLSEGALVAEACNLISSSLKEAEYLHCEVMYRQLINPASASDSEIAQTQKRADLVIASTPKLHSNDRDSWNHVQAVVEVKRANASIADINKDLCRLRKIRRYSASAARAFLIIVAEGKRPTRFVNENGNGIKLNDVPPEAGRCDVRRICKALHSSTKIDRAHYACIIEVDQPQ
jgi:hypothetical protein